ncbi:MAG: hypothetical protein U0931_23420 [Vulcanimicrobiota bacterium]
MISRLHQETRLDSAGKFTLDLARGLEKLAQLARTYQTRWALYALQAGVAGRAVQMHISSGLRSESVTLYFEGWLPQQLREPDQFTRFDGRSSQDSPMTGLLRQAVQWSLAPGASVNLVVEDAKGGFCLTGQQQNYKIHALPTIGLGQTRIALVRERPSEAWWKNPFKRARNSLALLLDCRWRLSFCPVPVKFDGLSLCSGMPFDLPGFPTPLMMAQLHLQSDQRRLGLAVAHPRDVPANSYVLGNELHRRPEWSSPTAQLGWLELVGGGEGALQVSPGVPLGDRFTVGSWWRPDGQPEHIWAQSLDPCLLTAFGGARCHCDKALFYHGRSRDLLYHQQYGVLLNPLQLTALNTDAWSMLVADDGIATDPTGLNPIHDQALNRRIEELEAGVRATQIRLAAR